MRATFVLPGFHRVDRGAEIALESVATGLAELGHDVTLVGGGAPRTDRPYRYRQARLIDRHHFERWPHIRPFRDEAAFEEFTFAIGLAGPGRIADSDVTVSCGYPFTNWLLTRGPRIHRRPAHVFVTQNGDFPAWWDRLEYRFFRCDGLVCTNRVYEVRNQDRWRTALIPNGVDPDTFSPGPDRRAELGIPSSAHVVLMVSALIDSKFVAEGIRAAAAIDEAYLVIAGDGPLRSQIDRLCAELLPERHKRLTLPRQQMPDLYRSADVLLHMSQNESFGTIYVEALCSGLPIVTHDHTVTRWILGDHPGLIDTSDHDAVVAALCDALWAGRASAASYIAPASDRFSWSTVAGQYEAFLSEVIDAHR